MARQLISKRFPIGCLGRRIPTFSDMIGWFIRHQFLHPWLVGFVWGRGNPRVGRCIWREGSIGDTCVPVPSIVLEILLRPTDHSEHLFLYRSFISFSIVLESFVLVLLFTKTLIFGSVIRDMCIASDFMLVHYHAVILLSGSNFLQNHIILQIMKESN